MKTKKVVATVLLGCSVMGVGMPAFAADAAIPEMKNTVSITANDSVVQPRAASYEITGDYVRLRTGAGLNSSVVGYLMKGDLVHAGHGVDPVYADGYYWLPVGVNTGDLQGKSGWVATKYLYEIG